MPSKELDVEQIRTDGGTQIRAEVSSSTVEEYAEAILTGQTFPPVVVFFDGKSYWLADGYHRVEAAKRLAGDESPTIMADVRQGTLRDAILYAVGANSSHGLRRTNADKRRAVETLLKDEEWSKWSDREIARKAGVHNTFVNKIRGELSAVNQQIDSDQQPSPSNRIVNRGGKTYTMDTSGIGTHFVGTLADAIEYDEELGGHYNPETGKYESTPETDGELPDELADDGKSEKPNDPPVMRDQLGIPITDPEMRAVFASLEEFRRLEQDIKNLSKRVADLAASPGGVAYRSRLQGRKNQADEHRFWCEFLHNARTKLEFTEPYSSVCPYCHHKGRRDPSCKPCLGLGWVTKDVIGRAAPEYVEAIKALAEGGES